MRGLILLIFSIITLSAYGQFDKPVSLRVSTNFDIPIHGLGLNTGGAGIGIDASFYSTHKLQALLEISSDWFIGDKTLLIDTLSGEDTKNANVYSIRAGPQFFLTPHIALSVTYGASWHVVRDFDYSIDNGFKYTLAGFLGHRRQFVTKFFLVNIPADKDHIKYLGIAAGYRFR